MNASCVICSDLFDETNAVSATTCGHVFHANCLGTWVHRSRTCPQCRSRIQSQQIQKLYLNFSPKSEVSFSNFEEEVVNLTSQLSAKELELESSKKEIEDKIAILCGVEQNEFRMQEMINILKHELTEERQKSQLALKLQEKVAQLEETNAVLNSDLQFYNEIHRMVNATVRDVEDILKAYNDNTKTAKRLATYCACLKRELLNVVESKDELIHFNSQLTRENILYTARVKFYEDALDVRKQ